MAGIVKSGREKTDLFAASHLVCFWPLTDIPMRSADVCFRG